MRDALPPLDLLKGFEAAARNLSFTKAGRELFLTQSAISRQIKMLEDRLGVQLFRRRHRELLLTEAGQTLYKATAEALRVLRDAAVRLGASRGGMITVTTTISFASLWLVPRLTEFRAVHPEIDVRIAAANDMKDLERDGIDLAIRYCSTGMIDAGAARLFGEEVFPVCAPRLVARGKVGSPQDLSGQVLLHLDDPDHDWPWLNWDAWLELVQAQSVKPAGALRFSHYDQLIQAALDGHGIALGRSPLVDRWVKEGRLVLPFGRRFLPSPSRPRAYFILTSPGAAGRPEVTAFSRWLLQEATAADRTVPERRSRGRRKPA